MRVTEINNNDPVAVALLLLTAGLTATDSPGRGEDSVAGTHGSWVDDTRPREVGHSETSDNSSR